MSERYPSPRALLEKHGLRAKKSWGQNFLGDETILDEIARLAAPRPGEIVVELGAGLGHLTARLVARGAKVVAVERDRDMARVLREELGGRIVLLEADAARLDYGRIAAEHGETGAGSTPTATPTAAPTSAPTPAPTATPAPTSTPTSTPTPTATSTPLSTSTPRPARRRSPYGAPVPRDTWNVERRPSPELAGRRETRRAPRVTAAGYRTPAPTATPKLAVVGNLPYHLTSPILFSLLDQVEQVSRAVFLVQREVAERLAAAPGTHEWGILSVLLQREADVSIERVVPPGAFVPPPRVESAVLCATFRPPRAQVADAARFRRLVKAGFAQRRKTLANALQAARIAEPGALHAALARAAIDPRRRGETLTVDEWAALDRALG